MQRVIGLLLLLTATGLGASGCGVAEPPKPSSSASTTQSNSNAATSVSPFDSPSPDNASAKPTGTQPKSTAAAATPTSAAEVTATDLAANIEPTTAAAAIAVINLDELAKFEVAQELIVGPFNSGYFAKGTLAKLIDFYKKQLEPAGWTSTGSLASSNEQYSDQLLVKDGYYLRLTLGSSSPDQASVNIYMLGNVDVRALPKTPDADSQGSIAVMANYRSQLSIAQVSEQLVPKLQSAGWQPVREFNQASPEVPNMRTLRFRKNASVVSLMIIQDPNSSGTMYSYNSESVMPIDLPMLDVAKPIKYEITTGRSAVAWKGERTELVELVKKYSDRFHWELKGEQAYLEKASPVLYLKTGHPVGVALTYVESAGEYWINADRIKVPE